MVSFVLAMPPCRTRNFSQPSELNHDDDVEFTGVTYYPPTFSAANSTSFCHAIWQPGTHKPSCVEYFLELALRSSTFTHHIFVWTGIPSIKCEVTQEKNRAPNQFH
jgi:hypothetical protein